MGMNKERLKNISLSVQFTDNYDNYVRYRARKNKCHIALDLHS